MDQTKEDINQKKEQLVQIYKNRFRNTMYTNRSPKSTTINHQQLPHLINSAPKHQNLHKVRHDANQAKVNLQLLENRINLLKKQKQKNLKQINWAKSKIELFQEIRQRREAQSTKKQESLNKKYLEYIYLKRRASDLKYQRKKDRQEAIIDLMQKRDQESEMVRTQTMLNETYLNQVKSMNEQKNKLKTLEVKQMRKQLNFLRQKYLSQKKNRANKINESWVNIYSSIIHKNDKKIKQLTLQQDRHLEQLKMTENSKLTTFKVLQSLLNPQSKLENSVYKSIFKKIFEKSNGQTLKQ